MSIVTLEILDAFLKRYGKIDFYNRQNPAHQACVFHDVERKMVLAIDFYEGKQQEYNENVGRTALYEIYSRPNFAPIIDPLWTP